MARVKKHSKTMQEMCGRLEELLKYLYGDDLARMQGLMKYRHQSTLRKALNTRDSFPDLERFNFLAKHPVHGCVVPNMNWVVNGIEEPLLQIDKDGKVSNRLTFGTYIDRYRSNIAQDFRRKLAGCRRSSTSTDKGRSPKKNTTRRKQN